MATTCFSSLKTLSIIGLTAILLFAFVPTTAIWSASYAVNIFRFAQTLRGSMLDVTFAKVEEIFTKPILALEVAADIARSKAINLKNTTCDEMRSVCWKLFQTGERELKKFGFNSIYFGDLQGAICGYTSSPDYDWPSRSVIATVWPNNGNYDVIPVEVDGTPIWNQTATYPYSQEDYYYELMLNETGWAKSAPFFGSVQQIWISSFVPIFDEDGQHYAYVAYDSEVRVLSDALRGVVTIEGAYSFVIECDTWYVLASSFNNIAPFEIDESGNFIRVKGERFPVPVVANTVVEMNRLYGETFSGLGAPNEQVFDFTFTNTDSISYFVTTKRIMIYKADIIVVMAVPQMYFLKEFIIIICVALSVSIILLLVSITFVVLGISAFVRPIYDLIAQLPHIENMDLDSVKFGKSFLMEIQRLQTGFTQMIAKLKEYRAFIPEHLLDADNHETNAEGTPSTKVEDAPLLTASAKEILQKEESSSTKGHRPTNRVAPTATVPSSPSLSSASSKAAKPQHSALFTLGLTHKEVTFLCLRVSSFKEMLQIYQPADFIEAHGQIIQSINPILKRNGGHMISFNREEMMIAFNAFKMQHTHVKLACQSALDIKAAMVKIKELNTSNNLPIIDLHMSITSGHVYIGNIGTNTLKQLCVEGEPVEIASKLAQLCPQFGCTILVDERVRQRASQLFTLRGIERLSISDIHGVSSTSSAQNMTMRSMLVHSLEALNKVQSDEWMYEMAMKEDLDKFDIYKQGFELYIKGELSQAAEKFKEALQKVPGDVPTLRLLNACEKQETSGIPTLVVPSSNPILSIQKQN